MQWEAYCLDNNIKSTIKTYKDNRFNGIFEVSAQVYHHLEDFQTILDTVKIKNAKQNRLMKALENSNLKNLIECLALFFHKITGPFWSLVNSPTTKFQDLFNIFQKLTKSLKQCIEDPNYFFVEDSFSFMAFPTSSSETTQKLATTLKVEHRNIIIAIATGILTALQVQAADFLEDGIYSTPESVRDLPKLPLTNLICERHFGHLDASQRRRPHSSLHHHSSVMLLKQTRQELKRWVGTLPAEKKLELLKMSREQGSQLRAKHREQDRKAVMDCLPVPKLCRTESVPDMGQLKQGQFIAVACEDAWYPAIVHEDSESGTDVRVSFGALGKEVGVFHWPTGRDVHTVSRRSIIQKDLDVAARASGRMWFIRSADVIQATFKHM